MDQRRRGLIGRLRDAVRGIADFFAGQAPPPPPEEEPVEYYAPPPEEDTPPPEYVPPPVIGDEFWGGDKVRYIPEHGIMAGHRSKGQRQATLYEVKVKARWKVDEPGISDVRDIFMRAGSKRYYTFMITGVPCYEYPTKPGENEITLSYIKESNDVWDAYNDPNATTAEEWANLLLEEHMIGNCWSAIYSIDVLDK